ncbi:MAG: hypothetical protein LBN42_04125 [Oscillospiraceae bacterium]|jgi:hypothetical protein|nr:hypothetical protein [Oscillospiraceae bacterium]
MLFSISYKNTPEELRPVFLKAARRNGMRQIVSLSVACVIAIGVSVFYIASDTSNIKAWAVYGFLILFAAWFWVNMYTRPFRAFKKLLVKLNGDFPDITAAFYDNRIDLSEDGGDPVPVGRATEEIYFEDLGEVYAFLVNKRICLAVPKRVLDEDTVRQLEEYFS